MGNARQAEGTSAPAVHEPWPPAGAQALDLTDVYATLARDGYMYGPTFQTLRSGWTLGEGVYAEVALSEQATPGTGWSAATTIRRSRPLKTCAQPWSACRVIYSRLDA